MQVQNGSEFIELTDEQTATLSRFDEKGRPSVQDMTDRALAEETLVILRATQDLVEKFFNDFSSGKMGGMMGMFGKLMG